MSFAPEALSPPSLEPHYLEMAQFLVTISDLEGIERTQALGTFCEQLRWQSGLGSQSLDAYRVFAQEIEAAGGPAGYIAE